MARVPVMVRKERKWVVWLKLTVGNSTGAMMAVVC
jgi:hypothetical protein